MTHGALRRLGLLLLAPLLATSHALAQADPRRDFVAALVTSASSQRDVQVAEAELAAARQARTQLEAAQRAALAVETAPLAARVDALRMRPAIQPSGDASTPLAAEVEALRARPAICPRRSRAPSGWTRSTRS